MPTLRSANQHTVLGSTPIGGFSAIRL